MRQTSAESSSAGLLFTLAVATFSVALLVSGLIGAAETAFPWLDEHGVGRTLDVVADFTWWTTGIAFFSMASIAASVPASNVVERPALAMVGGGALLAALPLLAATVGFKGAVSADVAGWPPAVQLALVVILALVTYCAVYPLTSESLRRTLLATQSLRREDDRPALLPVAYALTLAFLVSLVFFASVATFAVDRDWVVLTDSAGRPIPEGSVFRRGLVSRMFLYEFLRIVPLADIPERINWERPASTAEATALGWLVLGFLVTIAFGVLATARTALRREPAVTDADMDSLLAPGLRWIVGLFRGAKADGKFSDLGITTSDIDASRLPR